MPNTRTPAPAPPHPGIPWEGDPQKISSGPGRKRKQLGGGSPTEAGVGRGLYFFHSGRHWCSISLASPAGFPCWAPRRPVRRRGEGGTERGQARPTPGPGRGPERRCSGRGPARPAEQQPRSGPRARAGAGPAGEFPNPSRGDRRASPANGGRRDGSPPALARPLPKAPPPEL